MKLFMFDFLGLQSCFYSSCIYMFPDHSDNFGIALTDFQMFSQSQQIPAGSSSSASRRGEVGVPRAGEGRVQDRGLEPPPPEQQLPSTRIHKMKNEANLKGFGQGFPYGWLASQPLAKEPSPLDIPKNFVFLVFFCFFGLASPRLANEKNKKNQRFLVQAP